MKTATTSPKQTKTFARHVLKKFSKTRGQVKKANRATIIALEGELGSGKTVFSQGLARALGLKRKIASPTFLIIKNYELKVQKYKNFYHIDCYRIKKPKELLNLNFKKIVADPKNIIVVEWADKIRKVLPRNIIRITFKHGKNEKERVIQLYPFSI